MSLVPLATIKAGVGASGYSSDDALLSQLNDAAEAAIVNFLRRDLTVDFPSGLPADLMQAVVMLVYHLYTTPSDAADPTSDLWPVPVRMLLAPHRVFS